nr:MAG TPA: hypothetical protein [Caudoviricetes sp.]
MENDLIFPQNRRKRRFFSRPAFALCAPCGAGGHKPAPAGFTSICLSAHSAFSAQT